MAAARAWAQALRARDEAVLRVGVFGSYARGDAGVGSDLDFVVIVRDGAGARLFDVTPLPVPADVVVLEESAWQRMSAEAIGIARTIAKEAVWM
jgi:uncharacterized protein